MNSHNKLRFTDNELKEILKSIVVLIDTREKVNSHITEWFDKKGIKHKRQKLDFGDYSFMLPVMDAMGISRPLYFDRDFVIERKAHLDELSQNLAQRREQFENEFLRSKDCRKILLVEGGSFEHILTGSYGTQFKPESYFASLLTFQHRFNLSVSFIPKQYSAQYIFAQFYYYLREYLAGQT